ncbi:hypothetical protein K0M31_013983, partial [Melipona bicolor]
AIFYAEKCWEEGFKGFEDQDDRGHICQNNVRVRWSMDDGGCGASDSMFYDTANENIQ